MNRFFPKAGEMFNFFVLDDLRNNGHISHDMYIKNANEESIDVLLNQSIVVKHLRERQLFVLKILIKETSEILADLRKDYI